MATKCSGFAALGASVLIGFQHQLTSGQYYPFFTGVETMPREMKIAAGA